jgi:hypothetical protein
MAGSIRVTFRDRQFFDTQHAHFANDGIFRQGDGVVHVAHALSTPTTYHCELVDANGNVLAQSHETGGDIIPAS